MASRIEVGSTIAQADRYAGNDGERVTTLVTIIMLGISACPLAAQRNRWYEDWLLHTLDAISTDVSINFRKSKHNFRAFVTLGCLLSPHVVEDQYTPESVLRRVFGGEVAKMLTLGSCGTFWRHCGRFWSTDRGSDKSSRASSGA